MPFKKYQLGLVLFFFFCFFTVKGQLTNFTFSVTPTNETCTGNGSLSFSVANTTAGATITYAIYLLPNSTTPIATTSLPTYGGLSAGNYQVIATQTLGLLSNTQSALVQINSLITTITYQLNGQQVNCVNANLTVQVITGTPVSYEIISGPQIFPPQASNYFPNLGPGTYTIRVNDACGDGVSQTYTVNYSNPPNLNIGQFTPSCELTVCNRIQGDLHIFSSIPNSAIRYPLVVQSIAIPPGGGNPVTYSQTITSGGAFDGNIAVQVPFYHGQSYNYSFSITDACGNVYTSSTAFLNQSFTVSVTTNNVGCLRNLKLEACTYKLPLQVAFLSAPSGFNPTNFNATHPGPFMTSTISYTSTASNSLPVGAYTIQITDACGRVSTVTTNVLSAEPGFLLSPSTEDCATVYNYTMPLGNGTQVAQVIVVNAPPAYSTNLPLNVSSQIVSGSINLALPSGNYTINGTDVCGNPFSYSFFIPPISPNVTVDPINLSGCGTTGIGTIRFLAQGTQLQSIILTSTTSNFPNPLPFDFSNSIVQPPGTSALLFSMPFGSYTFTITDTCGNSYQRVVDLNLAIDTSPNNLFQLSGCGVGFGSIKLVSPNGIITSASITAAPSSFNFPLPYSLNSAIDLSGRIVVNDLPEGLYTIQTVDACGVERIEDIPVLGFHFQEQIQVLPACNSFSLDLVYTDNNYSVHKFWLQKWNPQTSVWEHPITGFDYVNGNIPDVLNSYLLTMGINNNIASEGHFRILTVFESFNPNSTINVQCVQPVKEFDFSDVVSIDTAFSIVCPNAGTQVVVIANGIPPLHYSITAFNGNPVVIDNGTDNVFSGLAQGLYNFTVVDNCGNVVNRDFDIGLLTQPSITGQNFCDGQVGQLYIDLVNSYTYQWWNAANPSVILSTSNILTFSPFSSSTSPGTYIVQMQANTGSSCANLQYSYVIPSNPNPDAGDDGQIAYCTSVGTIDLFSILQGNFSTNGQWTTTSTSGVLTGNLWDATNAPFGIYVFEYRVDGLCGAFDTAQVSIELKAPIPDLNLMNIMEVCSNTPVQLNAPFIPNATYSWTGPNGFTSSLQEPIFPAISENDSGMYVLTVSREGCQKTGTIQLQVNALPEFTIEQGCNGGRYKIEVIPINNSFDPMAVTYQWSGPSGFSAAVNPLLLTQVSPGLYTISVEDASGCVTNLSVPLSAIICDIPNVITPNQDGANDSFDLVGFEVNRLEIFNRWGRKVYDKADYINEWHGQNQQGELLPDGVYYYLLEFRDGQNKKGWIAIIGN